MTCCIAALAKDGSIVLVSDKMVGNAVIQGEPEGVQKIEAIHRDWWALFSGEVALAGDLFSRLRTAFSDRGLSVDEASMLISKTLYEKWESDTEWAYLRKNGFTTESFRDDAPGKMLEPDYEHLRSLRNRHALNIDIIVAGFDAHGKGHILSCHGDNAPGQFVTSNHDMLGRYAIGSGAGAAMWMMSYKDVGPLMTVEEVAYYTVEGKYYGELGQGVGACTDLIIIRPRRKAICIDTKTVDECIIPVCVKLRPRKLKKKHLKRLNDVRGVKVWGL